ncbi:hypothetical protein JCM8547_005302 [Rhodosporidiobolus lusitaniae]
MDTLLWNDNWVKTPPEELEATLHRLTTTHSSWIIDGNYLKRKEAFLSRATDIVWLDFPLYVTLWRLLKRTFARWRSQKPLFGTTNCREKLRLTFFSRESIIWCALFLSSLHRRETDRREIGRWCISQHRPLKKGLEEMLRKDMDGVKAKLRRRFTATEEVDDWVGAVEQLVKEQ